MWKKILLALVALLLAAGGGAFLLREEILLYVVGKKSHRPVAAHREVMWQTGPDQPNDKPNIVFILLDDVGINDLSLFGGGTIATPNIDRLAAEGALFTQTYAGTATCAPSRAALLTGRYPSRTGLEFTPLPDGMAPAVAMVANNMDNGLPKTAFNRQADEDRLVFDDQGLPGDEVTIAEVLRARGYHTVHIGKWHLGRGAKSNPNAQGFDESLLMASGLYLPPDDPGVVNAKLPFDPIDKFLWASMLYAVSFNNSDWFRPEGYLTDYFTAEAERAIDANRNRPFFLYLAHWGAHSPLQAAKADYDALDGLEPHRKRVYGAMLRALDRSVGAIADKLAADGLAENTIIVLSSDNGGAGYIGIPGINAPYRGWKNTLFEGGIRVPMVMRWPGHIAPGMKIATPVSHVDLMPTLTAMAGASLPQDRIIDGRDLTPVLQGASSLNRQDDAIFWSSGDYRVVRSQNWKLQVNGLQGKSWLFDLAGDPTEQVNLIDKAPAERARLQALLDAHWADARPPLYPHTIEAPIMVDKTADQRFEPGDAYVIWEN